MRFRTTRLMLIAFVVGLVLAPFLLPMLAPTGGPAQAQSLPWTPTAEATETPTRTPTRTPTAMPTTTPTVPAAVPSISPVPAADAPLLPSPVIVTPVYSPVPNQPGGVTDDGGETANGNSDPVATRLPSTPSPTPEPGTQPDTCEPNDSLTQPCALPTEIETTDLTFVDDSIDVFSFLLKGGRTYTIRASSTTGIDPAIRLFKADDPATVLVENDDVQPGTTDAEVRITTTADAWYLLVVENKAPGDMRRRTYAVSARSSVAEQPTPNATLVAQAGQQPVIATVGDVYENNYSPETAPALAWGVPYDLSLVCPDPGQCPGGDHDFFWVPVKAGIPLVAITYDLGPAADPELTLYRPEPNTRDPSTGLSGWQAWASNDDVVPGFTLRAQLFVTPDWNGYALLVVAPSDRANPPPLPPVLGTPGRYRLIIGPPGLDAVQQVLDAQTDIPLAPTTAPTVAAPLPPTSQPVSAPVAPTPVSDAREVIRQDSVTGEAVVVIDGTRLYAAAPPTANDELAVYPEGALVILLGQTYAGWVKVQPVDAVTPGWMFGPNLRPLNPAQSVVAPSEVGVPGTTVTPGASRATQTPGVNSTSEPTVEETLQLSVLPPVPTPTAVSLQPEARTATIEVCAVPRTSETTCVQPLEGIRVELVRVSDGTVLFVGLTNRDGRVSPSITVAPGTAVDVQIAALGLRARMPTNNNTVVTVRVIEEVSR